MEISLKIPTMQAKEEIISIVEEMEKMGGTIHGSSRLRKNLEEDGYETWMLQSQLPARFSHGESTSCKSTDYYLQNTFLVIENETNKVIGFVNLRYNPSPSMGHIELSLVPQYRNKGIGKKILALTKPYFSMNGVSQINCCCDMHNEAFIALAKSWGGIETKLEQSDEKMCFVINL